MPESHFCCGVRAQESSKRDLSSGEQARPNLVGGVQLQRATQSVQGERKRYRLAVMQVRLAPSLVSALI